VDFGGEDSWPWQQQRSTLSGAVMQPTWPGCCCRFASRRKAIRDRRADRQSFPCRAQCPRVGDAYDLSPAGLRPAGHPRIAGGSCQIAKAKPSFILFTRMSRSSTTSRRWPSRTPLGRSSGNWLQALALVEDVDHAEQQGHALRRPNHRSPRAAERRSDALLAAETTRVLIHKRVRAGRVRRAERGTGTSLSPLASPVAQPLA